MGNRSDTERQMDLFNMLATEVFQKRTEIDETSQICPGCANNSKQTPVEHTCPHEVMELLTFAYNNSESAAANCF